MKKIVSFVLIGCMMVSISACGNGGTKTESDGSGVEVNESVSMGSKIQGRKSDESVGKIDSTSESVTESDISQDIDNEAWNSLEALGNIETENGLLTVSITIPSDFAGKDITQASLDEGAGEKYVSAKLNEDGSITYKLTKKQHKAMMEGVVQSMDESLQEMVDSDEYSITEVVHNDEYTLFEVSLSGDKLGFADGIVTMVFYMYGGIYGLFTGITPEKVIVNYYNQNGELISTADSSKMGS